MQSEDADIRINLGIDFGARYTKVCFFSEELGAHLVDFGEPGLGKSLFPSLVLMDKRGQLSMSSLPSLNRDYCNILNLKMAVLGLEELELSPNSTLIEGRSREIAKPISAFFLANVIKQAKDWIGSVWNDFLNGRRVIWSANVGIPAECADSAIAQDFQEFLAVTWKWAEDEPSENNVSYLGDYFEKSLREIDLATSPCQIYPSIAATFAWLLESQTIKNGTYAYFEVGSRIIDGALFKITQVNKEMQIQILYASFSLLGVDSIVEGICKNPRESDKRNYEYLKVKSELLNNKNPKVRKLFLSYSEKVANFVGKVVYQGKLKDYRLDWRDGTNLRVFLGAAGVQSSFYRTSILSGHKLENLWNFGIPNFDLSEVPFPKDLNLSGAATEDYHRFFAAYGLSRQLSKRVPFKLPSSFPVIERRIRTKESGFEASNPGGHAVF